MSARSISLAGLARWSTRLAILLGFVAGVILIMLKLAGKFEAKVPPVPGKPVAASSEKGELVATALLKTVPRIESAVGSIRAVHETSIGAKLLARVIEVNVKAGQAVHEGDVLFRMDDTDLKPKLNQVKAAVSKAEVDRQQAIVEEKRYAEMRKVNAVSAQEYENRATALQSAEAELKRAQEAVNEVQATLDWATVRAPISGVIVDKKVNVGDMVAPGQTLATLFDPNRMQLVASVRETLADRLKPGQTISVLVERLGKECSGTISEIVPESQAASRSFQVKVTGPCPTGIYSGMFGRLLIPLGDEKVLVVPRNAVRTVGQLELVEVIEGQQVTRRAVRTGRNMGDEVEILSGLREGERVTVSAPAGVQESSHE